MLVPTNERVQLCSNKKTRRNAMGEMEMGDLITCYGNASENGIMCIITSQCLTAETLR